MYGYYDFSPRPGHFQSGSQVHRLLSLNPDVGSRVMGSKLMPRGSIDSRSFLGIAFWDPKCKPRKGTTMEPMGKHSGGGFEAEVSAVNVGAPVCFWRIRLSVFLCFSRSPGSVFFLFPSK